jgi:hypothetical protein
MCTEWHGRDATASGAETPQQSDHAALPAVTPVIISLNKSASLQGPPDAASMRQASVDS